MDITSIVFHINKFELNYFGTKDFATQFKNQDGYIDSQKLNIYLNSCLFEDFGKMQNLLIHASDVAPVVKFIQYLLDKLWELEYACGETIMDKLNPGVNDDIQQIANSKMLGNTFGVSSMEKDYKKRDAFIYREILNKVSDYAFDFKMKIKGLLSRYEDIPIIKEEPALIIANNSSQLVKEAATAKEPELIITSVDDIIAIMCALRERKIIITGENEIEQPTSKQLAEIIFNNFKVKKDKGEGFFPFDTLERYFGLKNDEVSKGSKFQKRKKEFLKALE